MADWRRLQEKIQEEQEQERQRAEQLREQHRQQQIFLEAEETAHRMRQWREWRLVHREAVDAYRQVRDDNMRRELQRERHMQRQREEEHQRELQRLQELNRSAKLTVNGKSSVLVSSWRLEPDSNKTMTKRRINMTLFITSFIGRHL
jgi:hypothetical protein